MICGNLTICAKAEYEGALLGEDLDVMIMEVGDHDVAVRVCCHVVRSSKLGTIGTTGTKLCQHLEKFFFCKDKRFQTECSRPFLKLDGG